MPAAWWLEGFFKKQAGQAQTDQTVGVSLIVEPLPASRCLFSRAN
ncbi:Hypothetical protein Cp262_1449 [Corynebacterium pseudotuberculosis]|nr:Hypothetical protein Cp262_1449 [Corynebacterium pseudotuberculosis]